MDISGRRLVAPMAIVALSMLGAPASYAVPASQADHAASRSHHHVVKGTRLCRSFGVGDLTCKSGFASSAGTMTHYQARAKGVDVLENATLMHARHTTCRRVQISFFATNGANETHLKIVTVHGTVKARTQGSATATVSARVSGKPFSVRVSVPDAGSSFFVNLFLSARAVCGSRTGQ